MWIAGAFLVVSLAVLATGYLRSPAPQGVRLAGFFLKLLAVLALVACLLEPAWTAQRAKPGETALGQTDQRNGNDGSENEPGIVQHCARP